MTKRQGYLTALSIGIILVAGAQWAVRGWAEHASQELFGTLLPGFKPALPSYKKDLVTYVIFVLAAVFTPALVWLRQSLPDRLRTIPTPPRWLLLAVGLIGAAATPFIFVKLLFVAGACAAYFSDPGGVKLGRTPITHRPVMAFLFAALAVGAIGLGVKAWYPVIIPNDYYELLDSAVIKTGDSGTTLPHTEAMTCLRERLPEAFRDVRNYLKIRTPPSRPDLANMRQNDDEVVLRSSEKPAPAPPYCKTIAAMSDGDAASLLGALNETDDWASLAGRTLYHHSYMFVPARHFLDHGLNGQVAYLYGYGNTLVQSLAFVLGGPTLSAYFNALPIFEFGGILAIALMAFGISRSWFAAFSALALSLIYYYSLTYYRGPLLAASFNPIRYLGLVAQAVSIAAAFRLKGSRGALLIPASLAFSCFWNGEYAVVGCFGQGLALLSPHLNLGIVKRLALVGLSVVIIGVSLLWKPVSEYFLVTTSLGFFNIAVPTMPLWLDIEVLASILAATTILLLASFTCYKGPERHIRISLTPIIALSMIKFYYNPSPYHLSFVYIFTLPLALTFVPWAWLEKGRSLLAGGLTAVLLSAALLSGVQYWEGAVAIKQIQMRLAPKPWTSLGETILNVTPVAPIQGRVNAIKHYMRPTDRILLLSPIDHLLSFYVSPASYCGHFEMLTNFTSTTAQKLVERCVNTAPNVLVIYDHALETPCRVDFLGALGPCEDKWKLKMSLQGLMGELKPHLKLIGEEGDLMFYRPQPSTTTPELSKVGATAGQTQAHVAGGFN